MALENINPSTVFEIDNNIVYLSQVSHPQINHISRKEDYTFKKLIDPKNNNLLAVVHLAFMFPINKNNITKLSYSQIQNHRTFSSESEKSKYIGLLSKELQIINSLNLEKDALKLYQICEKYPDSEISKKCIQFKLLDKKVSLYKE